MLVDEKKCVGCGNCVPICTMGVISIEGGKADITQEECVECETCYRVLRNQRLNPSMVRFVRRVLGLLGLEYRPEPDVCPTGALTPPKLEWPRTLRKLFSDPTAPHEATGMHGRGTEEIKTNEVTGRLREGRAGFVVELGRPGVGAFFREIERMAMGLAPLGVRFEPRNPVTMLMNDPSRGKLQDDILEEKVMSAIIEFQTDLQMIPSVLERVRELSGRIDTVCSVGVSAKCGPGGDDPTEPLMAEAGFTPYPNGKTNLGLGRPKNN